MSNRAVRLRTSHCPPALVRPRSRRCAWNRRRWPTACGSWGADLNSLAMEFRDFMAVVDGPLSEERSLAVIAEVQKLAPNKPIRYVVNTHHHFDHSGGLRTYVAEGATIITHQSNRAFYESVVFHPGARTLQP